jgi:tape measure domain
MGRLSFAIALNLITDGFKKGVNDVKGGFSSMQAKILTFSAAFGLIKSAFASFSSQVLDIVRDTNRASTALKNVSGSAAEFAGNQRFLIDTSKKYGANVNDLSAAYAKFTASAKLAGMPLSIQKSLFESVSRATAAFALSSEDTNSVFLALSQMMGKGKVQAQELRLQMGEKLPVALQAMAKAAGVSVGELDNMMMKGELLSGKVLPKFGKALDELIPNVDTDHLETSVNKMQNAKIELLKSTPVSDTYKLFIDSITGAVTGLTSALNSTGMQNFFAGFKTAVTSFADYVKTNFKSLVVDIVALLAGIKISQLFSQWKSFSKALSEAMITNSMVAHSKIRILESSTARLKRQIATDEVNLDKMSADERLGAEIQLNAKKKQLANTETMLMKAKNTARVADERAAAVQSGTAWEATWAKIRTGATALGVSLKAVWATVGPMILITLVTELIGKFVEWYNKTQQIKNAYKDYRAEANKAVHTREITELENLKQQYNAAKKNSKERFDLEKRIGDLTGQKVTGEQSINKILNERIGLLKASAAVEFYTNKSLESKDRVDELKAKYGGNAPGSKKADEYFMKSPSLMWGSVNPLSGWSYDSDKKEYAASARVLSDAQKKLAAAERDASKYTTTEKPWTPVDDSTDKKKKDPAKTELENAEQRYAEEMMKIALSEKKGLISSEAATEARQKLVVDLYSELATSKYPKVRNSDLTKKLSGQYAQIENDKPLEGIKKVAKDFQDKQRELTQQYNSGAITQEEYNRGVYDSTVEAKKAAAAFMDISSTSPKFLDVLSDLATSLSTRVSSIKQTLPTEAKRDTTFDYKKSNVDILGEQVENAKKQLEDLKSMAVQGTEQMVTAVNEQLSKVTSLSDALKLAEVKKDVKEFSKELKDKTWNGIRDIADGSDRIVSSWQQLGQTLNSADASGWEKIMSIWNALESSVEGILGIIETIKEWTKASQELKSAKAAEAAVTVAANAAETTSPVAATAVSTAASEVGAAENRKTVAGNIAAAGSEVVKQNSKIPIVGIALAAAGLVAVLAMFGKLPKFANGGIIGGGSTSGDNMLARVNSGEMILNGTQQKRLFGAINNGSFGGGQQQTLVSTKVRGEDLFLTLRNYMRSKNKRW